MEKKIGTKAKRDIEEYGIEKFNRGIRDTIFYLCGRVGTDYSADRSVGGHGERLSHAQHTIYGIGVVSLPSAAPAGGW